MELTLSRETEALIAERVAAGDFTGPSEVVEAAVRALAEDEAWWADLRASIADAERGYESEGGIPAAVGIRRARALLTV